MKTINDTTLFLVLGTARDGSNFTGVYPGPEFDLDVPIDAATIDGFDNDRGHGIYDLNDSFYQESREGYLPAELIKKMELKE